LVDVGTSAGSPSGQRRLGDPASRIVIVGANGAGKTWLANRLGHALGMPVVHNDALTLTTGWARRSREDVARRRSEALRGPRWIIEGGPSILVPDVLDRATQVVWLDTPRGVRLWRIATRSLRFTGRTRPEHPPGNREWPGRRQLRFLWGAWRKDGVFRDAISSGLARCGVPVVRLRSRADVLAFLQAAREGAEGL